MIPLIINLGCIAVLLLAAYTGFRHGVLRTGVKLVLLTGSILLSAFLAKNIGPTLSEKLPMPGVGTKLASFLNLNMEKLESNSLNELLVDWGFSPKAAQAIASFVGNKATETTDSLTKELTPAIDLLFTQVLIFVFLLVIFWLVTLLLMTLINRALEIKLLDNVNRFLGMTFGLVCGFVMLYVLAFAATWCLPLLDASLDLSLTPLVSDAFMIRLLNAFNPFAGILS